MRFSGNYIQVMLSDTNGFKTLKSNMSTGIFKTMLYGGDEMANTANELMVMNTVVKLLSPANLRNVFAKEDLFNESFTKRDMRQMYVVATKMRDEYRINVNKPHHGYLRVSGGRIVLAAYLALFTYFTGEFLVRLLGAIIKQWQLKNIGKEVLPGKAANRKIKAGAKDVVLKSALRSGNLSSFVTTPKLAQGLVPDLNLQQAGSSRVWARAGLRQLANSNPLTGIPNSLAETLTGVSGEEAVIEQMFKDKK
jgi:hypothetical protein